MKELDEKFKRLKSNIELLKETNDLIGKQIQVLEKYEKIEEEGI